ncbi:MULTISPECIES: iron chaperone [unclassified Nocardioides]|uniref:iron chaperone n=1 Tax=unclassified Nocardioides TaxID=2615069 RepID=UPI003621F3E9
MTTTKKTTSGFTDAERAAMKERAAELKAEGKKGAKKADDLQSLLEKIAEMEDADRVLAERIHAIVTTVAPDLDPKTWYGMPAYGRNGKAIVFFKPAAKFGARYSNLGFNDGAQLDDGNMWPTEYAITTLTDADVARIEELVRRAAG